MHRKYRNRTEIIDQILQAANGGITKNRIMYSLFLSHEQLKEYLLILIENGLLVYLQASHTYKTTEKGLKFLKILEQIQQELAPTTNNNNSIMHDGSLSKKVYGR
jgi:predicted transcriptional regulator